jgi:hypothetical protein
MRSKMQKASGAYRLTAGKAVAMMSVKVVRKIFGVDVQSCYL